ncbi:MAG: ATP synthase F1 subunit gamma [Clostridia bacterium]|nr:ATP synthase F1 subunit gamma [Clostridia bacterium]
MNDIKSRIKSVNGTMQITKAMELVATSKLRRAKLGAERSRPFRTVLDEVVSSILPSAEIGQSIWASGGNGGKHLFIVIAGDRGLAGGYNANVFRLTAELSRGEEAIYLPVGKKALEYYRHRGASLLSEEYSEVSDLSVGDTFAIADAVCRGYLDGVFGKVTLIYTEFVSMLTQTPKSTVLLPMDYKGEVSSPIDPILESDPEELLAEIMPKYIGGVIHSAICEALASESGARRTAMNAANKNAEEMIGALMLKYNRARQAIITQEITEIVSGAEAL